MTEDAIARKIVDAAFKVHTLLGLRVVRQQPIPVVYERVHLDMGFRAVLIKHGITRSPTAWRKKISLAFAG